MLINDLCLFYDQLVRNGTIHPKEYKFSNIPVDYLVLLSQTGNIQEIIEWTVLNTKNKPIPKIEKLPKRLDKSNAIVSNILEHDCRFLFGIEATKEGEIITEDKKNQQRWQVNQLTNLSFLEEINSPIVQAYCALLKTWQPEQALNNPALVQLCQKEKQKLRQKKIIFGCLDENKEIQLLHKDAAFLEKWIDTESESTDVIGQSAISLEENQPIARLHHFIKGIPGSQANGASLVSFNADAFTHNGKEQAYSANISETDMLKYTTALNYLIHSPIHTTRLQNLTLISFILSNLPNDQPIEQVNLNEWLIKHQTPEENTILDKLKNLNQAMDNGTVTQEQLDEINQYTCVTIGLEANAARIMPKFYEKQLLFSMYQHIANVQQQLKLTDDDLPLSVWRMVYEVIPTVKKRREASPDLDITLAQRVLTDMTRNQTISKALYNQVLNRLKRDQTYDNYPIVTFGKARIIRGYLNLNKKGDHAMSLDESNQNDAYLYGRIIAIVEKMQKQIEYNEDKTFNKGIVDLYFSKMMTEPAKNLSRLIEKSNHYLSKMKRYPKQMLYYKRLLNSVLDLIEPPIRSRLNPIEQGEFVLGYYHQNKKLYEKINKGNEEETCQH